MMKEKNVHEEAGIKPPPEVSHEEQFEKDGAHGLDGHMSSENPHAGRFADKDSDCVGDCPVCG